MSAERVRLVRRKEDLVEALRTLERDHQGGAIDPGVYRISRERYESEAAAILERLDCMAPHAPQIPSLPAWRSRRSTIVLATGGVLLATALLLAGALRARGAGQSITGLQPTAILPLAVSPAVRAAERRLVANPRSATAWTALGRAQLNAGNAAEGLTALRQAIRLDSRRAEAPTLLAVAFAAEGRRRVALRYLRQAEQAQPRYARAWLWDGIVASRNRSTLPRAIASFSRFLRLEPNAPASPGVRKLLAAARRAAPR